MKTISKETLVDFATNNDFAFVHGAGFMTANDDDTRKCVVDHINEDGQIVEEIEDLEEEGCGCDELSGEKENGCIILKVWNYNEEPLYIAYYE